MRLQDMKSNRVSGRNSLHHLVGEVVDSCSDSYRTLVPLIPIARFLVPKSLGVLFVPCFCSSILDEVALMVLA